MRLGTTVLLGFILVLSLVTVVGYFSIDILLTHSLEKSAGENSLLLGRVMMENIDRAVSQRNDEAQVLSNDSSMIKDVSDTYPELDFLQEQIESINPASQDSKMLQSIALLDTKGKILYSFDTSNAADDMYTETLSQVEGLITPGSGNYFIDNSAGTIFSISRSRNFDDGKGLYLVIKNDVSPILKPILDLKKVFLLSMLVITLLSFFISFFLSNIFLKPIKTLKNSSDKISKGFLSEPIEIKGNSEISELAASLDTMRYSLKMVIDQYEKMKGNTESVKVLDESHIKPKKRIRK